MKELNGWHVPGKDSYFTRFIEGVPRKNNGFQREHLKLALDHVKDWDVAIDVGAHVGFWTIDMAAKFDHVFAFEPAPDTYECLLKNTEGFDNVTCTNAAVGPYSGKCRVVEDAEREGNSGARFIVADEGDTTMVALDELKFVGCDFLKIDVEGYEPGVLEGAHQLIKTYGPVIIMETDKRFAGRYGFGKSQARIDMARLGYQEIQHLEPDKRKPGATVNAIRPDRIFVPGD